MMAKPRRKAKPIAPRPKTKNGHGGKREGAGRPRDQLPQDVIDRLGPPPATPAELRTWNAKLLAEVQWLAVRGLISTELAASIRANSGAIDRALPAEQPKPLDDDEHIDDDEDEGAELEEGSAGDGSLRVE